MEKKWQIQQEMFVSEIQTGRAHKRQELADVTFDSWILWVLCDLDTHTQVVSQPALCPHALIVQTSI